MGKPTGFMEFAREMPAKRPVAERIGDYEEFYEPYPEQKLKNQEYPEACPQTNLPDFEPASVPLSRMVLGQSQPH